MKITIIGAGINGLVAANYLARSGHEVTILERKVTVGGACCFNEINFNGVKYTYPPGASVFGLMPDFIFKETSLDKHISVRIPSHPDIVYFPDTKPCLYYEDDRIVEELEAKWDERGDILQYRKDLKKVSQSLKDFIKKGIVPNDDDFDPIWTGSARQLFDRYFTSEYTCRFHSIPVTESSPLSLDEPFGAFNIPLMNSGERWGFVKGGIWKVTERLARINQELGVNIFTDTEITKVDGTTIHFESSYIKGAGRCNGNNKADIIIFATDPLTADRLTGQDVANYKRYTGTSGKQILFFGSKVRWKGPNTFRFIFSNNKHDDFNPNFFEIYPDGDNYFSVFFKDVGIDKSGDELPEVKKYIESLVLPYVENDDHVGSVLLTPKDLKERFYFPGGNIDHMELCEGQTLRSRTFSSDPNKMYQFGNDERYYYCGAGAFPCGSVAGTAGYMCYKELTRS